MKKLIISKFPLRKKKQTANPPARITNETVAEHREQILAGGRKFKYPVQYVRHKLVINAVLIVIASFLVMMAVGWWQLYPMQNTSTLMYRVTRILPLPVGMVNGEPVLYSDYLVQYRLSEYYLSKYGEVKLDSQDGRRQLDYFKRQSMDKAIAVAYARQVARKHDISVTDDEVDSFIVKERSTASGTVSQETYDASIQMLYNQSPSDYRLTISNGILKNRVAFAIDDDAAAQAQQALTLSQQTAGDFAKVASDMATSKGGKIVAGQSGLVNNTSKFGGLRISEIAQIGSGGMSGVLKSETDDGYYIVKVIEKNDTQTNFTYVHIPLTQLTNDLTRLKKEHKISEYIKLTD
ncbi:MAG: SurA N-terminal domain-containing protein [Candidatus Saccharimonas sp.]